MSYTLTPDAIREIIEHLKAKSLVSAELRDNMVNVRKETLAKGDVLHALTCGEAIASLNAEEESYRYAVAAIETKTRVGMEEVDAR